MRLIESLCDSGDDGDTPTIHEEKCVTARRTHVCCECGKDISCGDDYIRTKGLWEGSWSTYKTCHFCAGVRELLSSCACYTDLRNDIVIIANAHGEAGMERLIGKQTYKSIKNWFNLIAEENNHVWRSTVS